MDVTQPCEPFKKCFVFFYLVVEEEVRDLRHVGDSKQGRSSVLTWKLDEAMQEVWEGLVRTESSTYLSKQQNRDFNSVLQSTELYQQPEWAWKRAQNSRWEYKLQTTWFHSYEILSREPSQAVPGVLTYRTKSELINECCFKLLCL